MSGLKRGNKLWEGSRMFLPEHKEQLLQHRRQIEERAKPDWDEQQWQQWSETIAEADAKHAPLTITVYDAIAPYEVSGTITQWRQYPARMQITSADGETTWIPLDSIIRIERV